MDFHIGFLNDIPVIELVIGVVVIVGAIYYFAVQREQAVQPVVIPEEEDAGRRSEHGRSRGTRMDTGAAS